MTSIKINYIELLQLRTIVISLGESSHAGWWKSQFLSPTGLSFLERLYPHTHVAAAVCSGGLAALEVHDANIGKGQVFHLFRLSQNTEYALDLALKEKERELEVWYQNELGSEQALISTLIKLGKSQSVEPTFGPVLLNIAIEKMVSTLAAYYLQAFQQGKQVFPYFEEIH